jgi:hypothetical protein
MNGRTVPFLTIPLVAVFTLRVTAEPQQIVLAMTPERIEEAIRLAADDKAAVRFLDAYVLQPRAGWGNGPLIGRFSTPFARLVQAALSARKRGSAFTSGDVTPDLIAPQLHIVATAQKTPADDTLVATVQSVVLAPRGGKDPVGVIEPLRTVELTTDYQNLTGTTFTGAGIVAIFPLTALTASSEIRVVFDRTARGSSALSNCRECVVPLSLARIR